MLTGVGQWMWTGTVPKTCHVDRYGAAEVDCTTAITLDPLYVKAYLRRAAARVGLQHLAPALEDYRRVLQLEPTNKQARTEIDRLEKVCLCLYWQAMEGGGGSYCITSQD